MADNVELDVINHLLEVEKDASALMDNAKIDADKKISEARIKYNQEYKAAFDKMAAEKDAEYNKTLQKLSEEHKTEVESFKKSFEEKSVNKESFNSLMDKLLFGKA